MSNMSQKSEGYYSCLIVLLSIPVLIFSSLWLGFIINKTWEWHIASRYGLGPIGVRTAVGVVLILDLLLGERGLKKDTDKDIDAGYFSKWINTVIAYRFALPAITLFIAWVVKVI